MRQQQQEYIYIISKYLTISQKKDKYLPYLEKIILKKLIYKKIDYYGRTLEEKNLERLIHKAKLLSKNQIFYSI